PQMQARQVLPRSPGSVCSARNLKSTFNYHPVFDTTAKIDFVLSFFARGKTDSERLLRLQRHKKLDCLYDSNASVFAPLVHRCEHFIENHYARNNRRPGEMPGQAGMPGTDSPANFKAHVEKFCSSHQSSNSMKQQPPTLFTKEL